MAAVNLNRLRAHVWHVLNDSRYVIEVRPDRHGHRYFLRRDGRWVVADSSGTWPHETDDGELFVDAERSIETELRDEDRAPSGGRFCYLVPLHDRDGRLSRTPCGWWEAQFVSRVVGMSINEEGAGLPASESE